MRKKEKHKNNVNLINQKKNKCKYLNILIDISQKLHDHQR